MTCSCLFHSNRTSFETTRRDLVKSKWLPRNVSHRLAMAVCSSCKRNDPLPGKAEIVSSAGTLKKTIEDKMHSVCTKGLAEYISTCLQVSIEDGKSESRLIIILLRALEGDFSLLQQVATSNSKAPVESKQTVGQKGRMTKHQIECMQAKRKKKMTMNQVTLPMFPGNIRRLEKKLDKGSIVAFERSNKCQLSFLRQKNSESFDNNVQRTYVKIWTKDRATYKSVKQVLTEKSKQVQRLQERTPSPARKRRRRSSSMDSKNRTKDIVDESDDDIESSERRRFRKRMLKDLEIENHELENKRLKMELVRMEVETEKMRKEIEIYDLKKVLLTFQINKQSSSP